MALNRRQQKLYTDTCDIYQRTRNPNSDGLGTPSADSAVLLKSGVLYYHEATSNFPELTEAARDVEANIMTTDRGHFDAAETVPDTGWIKHTTPGSLLQNRVFGILATDQPMPARGNRSVNKQVHPLRWVPKQPAGIT